MTEPLEIWAVLDGNGYPLGAFDNRPEAEKHAAYCTQLKPLHPACTYCRYVVPASLPSASEQWAPVLDDESMIACEEGQTYLFAIAMRDGHWEWFVNRLVWDSETEPTWGDDYPGWEPQEGMFFRELPAPPSNASGAK